MKSKKPFALLIGLVLAGCTTTPGSSAVDDGTGGTTPDHPSAAGPVVSLQVVHRGDAAALESTIAPLRSKGIHATLLVTSETIAGQCAAIKAAQAGGLEVGVFAQPENGASTLASLTREEQETQITALRDAAETCLGSDVTLFGCAEYSQNSDTYDVVNALGFRYNVGFVSRTEHQIPGHTNDVFPYCACADGQGFWAVPMHSLFFDGQWLPLADDVFATRVDPSEWGALLLQEFDRLREQNRPFLALVHTDTTGGNAARLTAFVALLDRAVQRGARFMTVSEYVAWAKTRPTDPVCEAP